VTVRFNHNDFAATGDDHMGYINAVTLALESAQVPTPVLGSEVSVYYLDCTLTNNETGQSLSLTYFVPINDYVRIDCEEHTVELNGLNLYSAMELDVYRRDWLTVEPGDNEFEFSDGNLGTVTVTIRHRDRWL
jgi:hypothetical protein